MTQPGPSSPSTMHFATYTYAYPNGTTPLSPLPKQLFMPPPDPHAYQHNPTTAPQKPSLPHDSLSPPAPPPQPAKRSPRAEYAIWSRRPQDPSHAPGIIISPNAKPPPHVLQQALELPTPPISPVVCTQEIEPEAKYPTPPPEEVPIVSSTATERTDATPTSPISSVTSVSTSSTKGSAPISDHVPPTAAALAPVSDSKPASPAPASSPAAVAPPTPTTPTPTAPKKSWASLLHSPTPSTSAHGRTRLPTSSVVGVSIPASSPLSTTTTTTTTTASASHTSTPTPTPHQPPFSHPALSLPIAKRTELLHLLTHTPPTPAPAPVVRPRGLINAGNMCFANSVLQVLVYCPPFHRLFSELARFGFGFGFGGGGRGREREGREREREGKGPTPLVDAMVEFVREFSAVPPRARVNVTIKVNGKGKGKEQQREREREQQREQDREDEDEHASFLPSYVYDAMKEKAVFDGMRSGQQEDAEEFLGFFLDALEEELLAVVQALSPPPPASATGIAGGSGSVKKGKAKGKKDGAGAGTSTNGVEEREVEEDKEDGWLEVGKRNRTVITRTIKAAETPITRIFAGRVRSTLKAPGQKDSVTLEAWRALRLDIQPAGIRTLHDALAHMAEPQALDLGHAPTLAHGITPGQGQGQEHPPTHPHPHPPAPGPGQGHASIQHLLEALPPVLVVHLKRFCYDTHVGGVVKIAKEVRWGAELEVGGDVVAPVLRRAPGVRYKLFGVVYHHGQSAAGGHYTLDVLHGARYPGARAPEGWMRLDDELVSDVRAEDVFAPDGADEGRAAYLLFYRRVG
ncbi:hypothetical protein H0H81_009190 [Sphagnurus paluster]|uniref:Ubiquitin carboxyl-terminal hydrolase n=1 Tax=Sphagnurus paluster TaxID=117069 RepID=A0A9P7GJR7_9AGAR|nr:hypothetical protein H0H81_009190 [Sphagnurus paluster]